MWVLFSIWTNDMLFWMYNKYYIQRITICLFGNYYIYFFLNFVPLTNLKTSDLTLEHYYSNKQIVLIFRSGLWLWRLWFYFLSQWWFWKLCPPWEWKLHLICLSTSVLQNIWTNHTACRFSLLQSLVPHYCSLNTSPSYSCPSSCFYDLPFRHKRSGSSVDSWTFATWCPCYLVTPLLCCWLFFRSKDIVKNLQRHM